MPTPLARTLLPGLILILTLPPVAAQERAAERVEALLAEMTLEEKVGQMTQVTLTAVAAEGDHPRGGVLLDPVRLREAVVERGVGSILNVLGASLSLDGWHELLGEIQRLATSETRLGIPVIYGIDFMHGANYTREGTIFPHNLGLAAAFDRDLVRRAARITSEEAIASGLPWNFSPVGDVGRIPLWPRYYETFGEDPFLAAEMTRAAVEGMEADGRVASTLKHYLAYSGSDVGRDRTPANLTERQVREEYLPPFRAGIEAGARAVMLNSGEIDGEPVHASRYWVTDVLRDELGFKGVVVTDWMDVIFLHTRHRVAPTMKDAVRMAVEAGIDMSMTPYDYAFADLLAELVREGTIPESRVDASVRRILTMKVTTGLLDAPTPDPAARALFAAEASRETARQAARATITLLQNDGVLPLRRGARVFVGGPAAESLTALNGGWTYVWQGTDAFEFPDGVPSLLDAIRSRAAQTTFVPGATFSEPLDIEAAARAAAGADVAVLAVGEDAYAEWVGDIRDLTLPEAQLSLIEAVQATGTPTVLVLVQGRPRTIHRVADRAAAIVMAYTPGMEGAEAIADVLYGEHNPSGRLPFTYPRHPNALDTYDHRYTQTLDTGFDRGRGGFDPQFAFGHGLSYTTFAYRDLLLDRQQVGPGDQVRVHVTVTNTGDRAGADAVLLFTRQHYASLTPPVRRLLGFRKVHLQPGESETITFSVPVRRLAFIGRDGQPRLERGDFDVMVGDLTDTLRVTP
jgi:beta-glucosidase